MRVDHRRRHVLLDGDLALQRRVPGEVDDAAACPRRSRRRSRTRAAACRSAACRAGMATGGAARTGRRVRGRIHRGQCGSCSEWRGAASARPARGGPRRAERARHCRASALGPAVRSERGARRNKVTRHAAPAARCQVAAVARRRNMPKPSIVSTVSSSWLSTSQRRAHQADVGPARHGARLEHLEPHAAARRRDRPASASSASRRRASRGSPTRAGSRRTSFASRSRRCASRWRRGGRTATLRRRRRRGERAAGRNSRAKSSTASRVTS